MESKLSIEPSNTEDHARDARLIARLDQAAATGDQHAISILEQLYQCRQKGVVLDVKTLSDAELGLIYRSYEMDGEL
jgi:hypothetical protein